MNKFRDVLTDEEHAAMAQRFRRALEAARKQGLTIRANGGSNVVCVLGKWRPVDRGRPVGLLAALALLDQPTCFGGEPLDELFGLPGPWVWGLLEGFDGGTPLVGPDRRAMELGAELRRAFAPEAAS